MLLSRLVKSFNFFKVSVLVAISFLLLYIFFDTVNINALGDNFVRNNDELETNSILFFTSIFFTPLIEELFFRKGLKYSFWGSLFLITGILYTITFIFLYNNGFSVTNYTFLFGVFVFIALGILIYNNTEKIKIFYSNYPKTIIFISITTFAYSHYPLYSNAYDLKNIIFSPILLSEYFLTGALFSFIRIKFSFILAILSHILWNYLVTFQ